MALKPDETDLIGSWHKVANGIVGDSVEARINLLIGNDLKKIAVNPESGGWEILYRDLHDGRYWELTYQHSEMHGGGPKRLTNLAVDAAIAKYRLSDK
jgi:hypothetical protein